MSVSDQFGQTGEREEGKKEGVRKAEKISYKN